MQVFGRPYTTSPGRYKQKVKISRSAHCVLANMQSRQNKEIFCPPYTCKYAIKSKQRNILPILYLQICNQAKTKEYSAHPVFAVLAP